MSKFKEYLGVETITEAAKWTFQKSNTGMSGTPTIEVEVDDKVIYIGYEPSDKDYYLEVLSDDEDGDDKTYQETSLQKILDIVKKEFKQVPDNKSIASLTLAAALS